MAEACEPKSFCSTRSSVGAPARYHKYDGWENGEPFDGCWVSLDSARRFAFGIQGKFLPDEEDRTVIKQKLAEFIGSFQQAIVKENLRFPRDEDLIFVADPYWAPVLDRAVKLIETPCEDPQKLQDEWNAIVSSCIANLRYFWNRESFEEFFSFRWKRIPNSELESPTSQPQSETQDREE